MGERKGQNHYYPPDFNYKKHHSLNSYHGVHALRERAKKIKEGILVIRFEMPFNIWCLGCKNHVGMGVRYNAEKKKCGMYYTTPLQEFRMKCHLCDNYFVIRTDPKNFTYELVEGCARQEKKYDPSDIDQFGLDKKGYKRKLASDAMFKKEHEEEDKTKGMSDETRIEKVEWIQERMRDDFAANQYLRAQFRKQKKDLTEKRMRDQDIQQRLSIGTTKLLAESETDLKVAKYLSRYSDLASEDTREKHRSEIESKRICPSFGEPSTSTTASSSAAELLKESVRKQRDLEINAKFGSEKTKPDPKTASMLGIVVRKREIKPKIEDEPTSSSLVQYSDSD